ncbi:hypothetical protein LC593_02005 [Nostoc sp. CHAB 5844]|nr:hypothetical protein [Nostoc sp. CHAB 5844]
MKTGQLHRAWWNYEQNIGIAKIHYPIVGVLAFTFEHGIPKINVNFTNEDEVKYYRQQYKKKGVPLTIGVQIDRDVDMIQVIEDGDIIQIPEQNLEIQVNGDIRQFRPTSGKWEIIDAPIIEFKRCDSLICVS